VYNSPIIADLAEPVPLYLLVFICLAYCNTMVPDP
jgi:hypothetical protein